MQKVHLARHAIYNLNGKVFGYELLFRGDKGLDKEITSEIMATSKVLLNLLTHMDFEKVIGDDKRAFININHEVVQSGILGLLKPDRFCLELSPNTEVTDRIIGSLDKLKKKGFQIALDDFQCDQESFNRFKPIMGFMTFVKMNASRIPAAKARKYLKFFSEYGLQTVAHRLETHEQYREAIGNKYRLFQGFHIKQPEVMEQEVPAETTRTAILRMISMIKEDKETSDIESYTKTQPDLAYNLIKYLNTPDVAPAQEISGIRQAISMIGRQKLVRWLLVYLYSESSGEDIDPALVRNAMNRADKMEESFNDKKEKEKAFLTGMFSLLDVVFDTPMPVIVRGLPVDNEIMSALLTKSGTYGKVLREIEDDERKQLFELVSRNFRDLNTSDVMKMLSNNKVDMTSLVSKK